MTKIKLFSPRMQLDIIKRYGSPFSSPEKIFKDNTVPDLFTLKELIIAHMERGKYINESYVNGITTETFDPYSINSGFISTFVLYRKRPNKLEYAIIDDKDFFSQIIGKNLSDLRLYGEQIPDTITFQKKELFQTFIKLSETQKKALGKYEINWVNPNELNLTRDQNYSHRNFCLLFFNENSGSNVLLDSALGSDKLIRNYFERSGRFEFSFLNPSFVDENTTKEDVLLTFADFMSCISGNYFDGIGYPIGVPNHAYLHHKKINS